MSGFRNVTGGGTFVQVESPPTPMVAGSPGGVATLDGSALVPVDELPLSAIAAGLAGDFVDLTTNQSASGIKTWADVANFSNLLRVRGRDYANVTNPLFGADPNGVLPSQAAIKAAWDSLPNGGTLYIPGGNYLCEGQVLLTGNKRVFIETDGTASALIFTPSSPLTDAVRLEDAGEFRSTGLRVRNSGGAPITNLFTFTTTGSAENVLIEGLVLDPQSSGVTNMLAIGPDTSLDIAELLLKGVYCSGVGCSDSVLLLGNGTQGNIQNIRAIDCLFALGKWGIHVNGAMIQAWGITLQRNSGADIKISTLGDGPFTIDGCRSENSKMFLENIENNQILGPVGLKRIAVEAFTNPTGHVIDWACLSAFDLDGFTAFGGPTAALFNFTSPGDRGAHARASVTARNILTETPHPFLLSDWVDIDWQGPRRYLDGTLTPTEILPTITAEAPAGSGATATLDTGSDDRAGQIALHTGATGLSAGSVVRVTYGSRLSNRYRRPVLTAVNGSAMLLQDGTFFAGADYFEVYTPFALAPSSDYIWNYVVGGY